jgi:ABC-2 type transport system permease protein
MHQFFAQARFETMRSLRNRRLLLFSLALPIAYYFLFVNVEGAGDTRIDGVPWRVYYLISMAAFSAIGSAMNGTASRIAFERTQGWLKLLRTTPLSGRHYVFGKAVSQLVIAAGSVAVLYLCGYFGESVRLPASVWILSFLWILVGTMPFIALGMWLGMISGTNAAQSVSSGLYLVLSLLGGLWFPEQLMPHWMQLIGKAMPTYRMAEVAWNIVAKTIPHLGDILVTVAYFLAFAVLATWTFGREQRTSS